MFKTLPLTVLGFLVGMGMLAAQVSFSVPNIETCQTTVSVPVTVNGFTNISAFSYSMEWDETVLDFDSVGAFNLAYLDSPDFGSAQQANGIVTTAWIDNDGVGKSRPNGTVIYRVYFTVIGSVGSTSLVQFKDNPTPIIAAEGFPPVVVATTTIDGSVTRDDTVPPTITCPAAQTVSTAGSTAMVVGLAPTAADNCTLSSVTYSSTGATNISGANNASGSTFNLGTTTVTYVATDGEGNASNCAVNVTVNQVVNAVEFFALSDTAYCADTTISIAVTTEGFTLLTAFSYTLEWDESVIRYVSRTDLNTTLPITASNFGTSQTSNGIITVAWVDPMATGKTLPNGDTLFVLNFIRQAGGGDESLIEFTDMPTSIVAAAFPAVPRPVVTVDGNASFIDNPPVLVNCPTNITVNTAPGTCAQVATWTAPTATDDCDAVAPVPVRTVGPASGSSFPVGVTTITYIATDSEGNVSTPCTFTVTVVDNQRPSIACPADITLFSNASCEATIGSYIASATVTDNGCPTGTISVSQTPAPGTVITDTIEVTLIATDAAGLKDTCTFDINLVDNTDPVITCPATPAPVDNAAGLCTAVVALSTATATDNCGIESITDNRPAGNIFPVDSTTVTFTATDFSGNTSTCSVVVVVNDTLAPVITCSANIAQSTDAGECSSVVTWAAPTFVDNCASLATVTSSTLPGVEFPIGDSTVVYIVTDPNGNADTCSFVVTVTDDELPVLECRADTLIEVPFGTVDTIIEDIYRILYTDNCSFDTAYYHFSGAIPSGGGTGDDASGTAFPVGTTTVTYFGEDAAGNIGFCDFDVVIEEVAVFSLTCAADQAGNADPLGCSADFLGVIAVAEPDSILQSATFAITGATTDNGTGLDASGSFNVGTSTVTFTAISNAADTLTCSLEIVVTDDTDPVFANCPTGTVQIGNTIDSCGLVFSSAFVQTATDNCPGVTNTSNVALGTLLPLGNNTITATATDAAGNTATCTYILEVIDNQPPHINNCVNGDIISVNNDPGHCGAIVTWPAITADGNCNDVLSFTFTPMGSGSMFPVGSTPVSYTAVDDFGNTAICTFFVIVEDNEAPVITCPANQPPVNTNLNQCAGTVIFTAPTATDNCGPITPVATTSIGPSFGVGTHTVSYSATDPSGNVANCSFTVTVVDNSLPFIPGMPADIIIDTDLDECGAIVTWTAPNFPIDNCAIESFGSSGGSSGDFFAVGTHYVIYVAFDVNGNFTRDTLSITVVDDQAPEILGCPSSDASITVDGSLIDDPDGIIASFQQMDCDNIVLNLSELIPFDNCGIASYVQTTGLPSGGPFPVGLNNFSYEVIDNNGNSAICAFSIDIIAPQVTPASVTSETVCEGEDVTFSVGGMTGAAYLWVKGNQTVSDQQTFDLNDVSVNDAGVYTALVSMAFCDLQFDVTLNVNPTPVITAVANSLFCATADLNLTATNSSAAVVTDWEWTFPNNIVVAGQNQSIPNPTVANVGAYTVVATSNLGCVGSGSVIVDLSPAPNAPFLYGTKSAICLGEDITINGQLYSGNNVTYHWYSIPAIGSGLTPINNPIVNVQPTVADTFKYYFYVEVDGCVSDTAEWSLIVEEYPVVILQVDGQTVCVDGTSDITLMDTGTGGTTWSWEGPFGPLPGNTSSVTLIDVTSAFNGDYTVTVTSAIGCSTTRDVTVNITDTPPPPAPITVSDNSICEGGFVDLTGTFYPGATYYWAGDGVPPNSQGQNPISVFPSGTGSFTYSYAAIVGGCSTDTITTVVVVEPMPPVDITVSGITDCVNGNGTITLSTPATGIANFIWTDADGNVLSNASSLAITNATSADSETIYLEVRAAVTGCIGYGSQTIIITDGISGLSASVVDGGCRDMPISFEASTLVGASYQWYAPNNALFSSEQNPTVANANTTGTGIYKVVATNDMGCTDTATVAVTLIGSISASNGQVLGFVNVPQEFNVSDFVNLNYGEYTVEILQQPLNGSVQLVGDSIYVFNPRNGFWGTDKLFLRFCNANCPDECEDVTINLIINYSPDECVITTVISPNGDGANDQFVVSCAEYYPLNKLVIFNEWGSKVFEAAPYDNTWGGGYEDVGPLPDGTYFYIFQRDPNTAVQKGFVMINR